MSPTLGRPVWSAVMLICQLTTPGPRDQGQHSVAGRLAQTPGAAQDWPRRVAGKRGGRHLCSNGRGFANAELWLRPLVLGVQEGVTALGMGLSLGWWEGARTRGGSCMACGRAGRP